MSEQCLRMSVLLYYSVVVFFFSIGLTLCIQNISQQVNSHLIGEIWTVNLTGDFHRFFEQIGLVKRLSEVESIMLNVWV